MCPPAPRALARSAATAAARLAPRAAALRLLHCGPQPARRPCTALQPHRRFRSSISLRSWVESSAALEATAAAASASSAGGTVSAASPSPIPSKPLHRCCRRVQGRRGAGAAGQQRAGALGLEGARGATGARTDSIAIRTSTGSRKDASWRYCALSSAAPLGSDAATFRRIAQGAAAWQR